MTKTKETTFRTRNYVSILYPESAVKDWQEVLASQHVQAVVSPLHDKDISADGTPKKPHYHVMILFQSPKTEKQAQGIFDSIGGIKCQAVNDTRSQLRYFCHMDDYDKAQYNAADVKTFAGIDYTSLVTSSADKYQAVKEMIAWVHQNDCSSFCTLMKYASEYNDNWFHSLCDNSAYVMKEYIKSLYWENTKGCVIDPDTGEIKNSH